MARESDVFPSPDTVPDSLHTTSYLFLTNITIPLLPLRRLMTARAQPPATAPWVLIDDSMHTAHKYGSISPPTQAFTPRLHLLSLHHEA